MACEYFVNGSWVSENNFKEILNNGLLDNLITSNKVSLKGFKVDNTKVQQTGKQTITRTTVPATKLAEILAQEIKSQSGYPLNMLSSLELNEDKSDFKIPLWSSPYATKFESLLTSIVSNKVVKQKLPGNSFVLGSEEGFKVKEGDATVGDLKNSNIVFSKSFDPLKGLQPMRYDPTTKKILPAQIMIPFKFRDETGKILDINQFITTTEDGKKILDSSKIPDKLLQLFGFRIPTQERNSMAAVEIVGFLPETSGDLMLAPRDFTKQMGSDFDVDKLYTYMYAHYYKDGKLHTDFVNNKERIKQLEELEKENLEDLKTELKITKEEDKIISRYIAREDESDDNGFSNILEFLGKRSTEEVRKALEDSIVRLSVLNRSYKASQQNKLLDIHLKMMTSTNPEIIASIVALDSFGEFSDLAKEVYKVRLDKGEVEATTSILSDMYQRTKYVNATAGKSGVGSFSLDSTFNASAQGKDLVFINLTEEQETNLFGDFKNLKTPTAKDILENNEDLVVFGNTTSKGDMSNKYTLRSQQIIAKAKQEGRALTKAEKESLKFKSTIIRALQSSAVDNEKEQILDKLNINDQTFDAIRALTILGFEEKEIAGLLTQEIIWEYVYKLRDSKSSLAKYQENVEDAIYTELKAKYDPSNRLNSLSEEVLTSLNSKSGEQLMDDIANKKLVILENDKSTTPDYNLEQLLLVEKFQKLTEIGKTIKQLQSTINADSKGIPKSLIETDTKVKQIENLLDSNVFNASKLLGEYSKGILETPTTISGFASKYGTMMANNIYDTYFPYKTNGFKLVVNEVLTHTPKGIDVSMSKQTETKEEVFNDIRSYLFANQDSNLFIGDPSEERQRLFIDSPNNQSLATILQSIQNTEASWYLSNGFLNKLTYDINQNGKISRINFEAATGENQDERNIYDGFAYLLTKNLPIGTFNGIPYTTRTLAQELVTAAFLEGGNQGSKQYLKYIPIAYIKSLGFGNYLQSIPFDFTNTFKGNQGEHGTIYDMPSMFTRQYFQNHPDKVKTVQADDIDSKEVLPNSFKLNKKALEDNFKEVIDPLTGELVKTQTHFISIKDNSKEGNKYALYEFDSTDRSYKRIPVLSGSYGFVGYNSQNNISTPIEKQDFQSTLEPQILPPGYSLTEAPIEPTKTFNINVVNNPVTTTKDLSINRALSGGKEALDDLLNNLEDSTEISNTNRQLLQLLRTLPLPDKFKVVYDNSIPGRGSYAYGSQTLTINLNHKDNTSLDSLATVVAHELIHTFTGHLIIDFESNGGKNLTQEQLRLVKNLQDLHAQYVAKLPKSGLEKFTADYNAWKANPETADKSFFADRGTYYGAMKLREFVTMALTDAEFQEKLNRIKDESGKTLWEQIKDIISNIIQSLGITVDKDSLLASAIKNSMDLINTNKPITQEPILEGKYELFPGVYANQGQTEALDKLNDFLKSDKKAFLLQGKGGTGKTTIIKKILEQLPAEQILAIAPSHKATKVLKKSINNSKIRTVTLASALAIKLDETTGKFEKDVYARENNKVPIKKAKYVIIDESSMVSDDLLNEIKDWVQSGAKIIFMGDRAQLPPVGQETDSKVFDIDNGYELKEKMRQAAGSPIIGIGTKVAANVETTGQRVVNPIEQSDRVNQYDEVSKSSIVWENNEDKALDDFVKDFSEDPTNTDNVKIITFNNQVHNNPQSVKNLNDKVRKKLYGDLASKQFLPGEIVTSYGTYTKDIGGEKDVAIIQNSEDFTIKSVEKAKMSNTISVTSRAKGTRFFEINYNILDLELIDSDGKPIIENIVPIVADSSKEQYKKDLQHLWNTDKQLAFKLQAQFADIQYGYAITSHKAQGSTYKNVYVMEDNIMGSSNGGTVKAKNQSLYVAVSRPTTKLVMVSSKNNLSPVTKSDLSTILKQYGTLNTDELLPSYREEVLKLSKEGRQNALTKEEFVSLTEQEQRTALWQLKNCK
jgi:exodeoxyribonuclease-5